MAKFHIRDNGEPGICTAKPGNCRYGDETEHHSTPEAARAAYEGLQDKSVSTLKKPVLSIANEETLKKFGVTDYSARTIELNGLSLDLAKVTKELGVQQIQSYGYAGSQLYGLQTEQSDIDLSIISEGKGRDKQKIIGEMDFRVYPIDKMMDRLWKSSTPETDLLFSRTLTFLNDSHEKFLDGFRVNSLKYYNNSDSLAFKNLAVIDENIMDERRQYKALKAATRGIVLAHKMLKYRTEFTPVFNDSEKVTYWEMMEKYSDQAANGADWETLYNGLHSEAKKMYDR